MGEKKIIKESEATYTVTGLAAYWKISKADIYYWINEVNKNPHLSNIEKNGSRYSLTTREINLIKRVKKTGKNRNPRILKSRHERKRHTVSENTIENRLGVEKAKARLLHLLLYEDSQSLPIKWAEKHMVYRESKFDKDHEKVLSLMGYVMGAVEIGAIYVRDGYPVYKYLLTSERNLSEPTIMYSISEAVYFIEAPQIFVDSSEFFVVFKEHRIPI